MSNKSGGSCDYYKAKVQNPITQPIPYIVECGDVINALKMDWNKANAFKEIFRMSNEEAYGAGKDGDLVRAAEKILFYAIQHARAHGVDINEFVKPLNLESFSADD